MCILALTRMGCPICTYSYGMPICVWDSNLSHISNINITDFGRFASFYRVIIAYIAITHYDAVKSVYKLGADITGVT